MRNVFFRRASLTANEILVRSRMAIVAPPPPLLSPPPRDDMVAYLAERKSEWGWGFARRCESRCGWKTQRFFNGLLVLVFSDVSHTVQVQVLVFDGSIRVLYLYLIFRNF